MGHEHAHGTLTATGRHRSRLIIVMIITLAVFVAEVVGGLLSGSLALLADAGHMLTDSAGLVIALIASVLAARPATTARTYGLQRTEVLAALVNGVLLVGIAGWVLVQAVERWRDPAEVSSGLMLGVALVGISANVVGLLVLRAGKDESLNLRGAYLEVLGDLVGSVAVVVAAVVILTTGWTRADPLASVLVVCLIVPRAWALIRDVVDVLLEATPRGGPGHRTGAHRGDARRGRGPRPARLDDHQRPAGALGPRGRRARPPGAGTFRRDPGHPRQLPRRALRRGALHVPARAGGPSGARTDPARVAAE